MAEYMLNEWRQDWMDDKIQQISLYMDEEERKWEYALLEERQAYAEEAKGA